MGYCFSDSFATPFFSRKSFSICVRFQLVFEDHSAVFPRFQQSLASDTTNSTVFPTLFVSFIISFVAVSTFDTSTTTPEDITATPSASVTTARVVFATFSAVTEIAKMSVAKKGLNRLKSACDTVVVVDNNRLVKVAGNLPFREALGVANTTIGKFVKGITETITTASLINLDYADLRAIMSGAGIASIGVGDGLGEGRVEQSVEKALNDRLLDIEDVTKARGLLIHVAGGEDLTLFEVNHAAEIMKRSLPPKAKIIWGARVDKELKGSVAVMAVVTGVESAFLRKREKRLGPIKLW